MDKQLAFNNRFLGAYQIVSGFHMVSNHLDGDSSDCFFMKALLKVDIAGMMWEYCGDQNHG